MANVTLTEDQFVTLAGWAEAYGTANDLFLPIRDFTEKLEVANGLTRQYLYVRWRDAAVRRAAGDWDYPPQYTQQLLRYTTPWTYEEVMAAVNARTTDPFAIEVTRDRTGAVGWYDIDTFFGR
ncbi:MAG: hypothetical protein KKC37_17110 [Proteobacteria bacterium]|nr:hypothetical protein [Pseudomonadota bacterium]